MSFFSTDPNTHQSENTWFTPPSITSALGLFDMDVCTVSFRPHDIARRHVEHDKGEDSLVIPWVGTVWMNPPYGKEIEPFIAKFKKHGDGVALVFARMGTPWMQDWVKSEGGVFFLRKRVRFIRKDGIQAANAGADSCFLYSGEKAYQRIKNSGLHGVFLRERFVSGHAHD